MIPKCSPIESADAGKFQNGAAPVNNPQCRGHLEPENNAFPGDCRTSRTNDSLIPAIDAIPAVRNYQGTPLRSNSVKSRSISRSVIEVGRNPETGRKSDWTGRNPGDETVVLRDDGTGESAALSRSVAAEL